MNISKSIVALAIVAVILSGCSFKSKTEKEADRITNAVIANNMDPVINDFDSQARPTITPISVARLSTELREQGKYQGIKEITVPNEAPGEHVFDAQFEKHMYAERMVLDDDGKVRSWKIHMKEVSAPPTP